MLQDLRGIATTAKIAGHPIHPMLIPFPIALLIATFTSDLVFWGTGDAFWGRGSFWLLVSALFMSTLAAVAGFVDFFGNVRIRQMSDAWQHMIANLAAVVLAMINLFVRWGPDPAQGVLPWGLLLSAAVVLLLLFSGWKGGSLVNHHRVGIHPEEPASGSEPPAHGRY
ncbi:DUF2231 domain-containing protein [Tianweitania sediminis]|uniref:DUF2231 domain-containing protein n=1 Tax=Tianweitania sediminis TaxID=1502156 RepID=A0A8J7RIV2_9HYPH|nr:DUF2231 domain-containing protein [Tianweitania sediminis]MBP0438021.1 DUF2231 domain-containing protein [Tianweitania sediminis]